MTWICSSCTTENNLAVTVCQKCSTWKCRNCSLHNKAQLRLCAACETPVELPDPEAAAILANIERTCREICERFADPEFPPGPSILGSYASAVLRWVRPNELRRSNGASQIVLYHGSPTASDISQGLLGDCWLLSALALITERPELINRVLVSHTNHPFGAYQIRLCVDGNWTVITIDDFLPIDAFGNLVFAKAPHGRLWAALVEKAAAKSRGGYEKLNGGQNAFGMEMLAGFPTEAISLPGHFLAHPEARTKEEEFDAELLWASLISAREAGFLVACSSVSNANGLLANHAYSLLDLQSVRDNKVRLVRLRNPWGHSGVWIGPWSDYSSEWSRANTARIQLRPYGQSEGLFWMHFDDFCKNFGSVEVCSMRHGWQEQRIRGDLRRDLRVCRLIAPEGGQVEIGLYQNTQRGIDLDLMCWICVERDNWRPGKLIEASKRRIKHSISMSTIVEPGCYLIYVGSFNSLSSTKTLEGTLAVWSSRPTVLEKGNGERFADGFVAFMKGKGSKMRGIDMHLCNFIESPRKFFGWALWVENLDPYRWLHVQVDASDSVNLVSSRESLNVSDAIAPMHGQIVIILSDLGGGGFYLSQRIACRQLPWPALGDWSMRMPSEQHEPLLKLRLHQPIPLV